MYLESSKARKYALQYVWWLRFIDESEDANSSSQTYTKPGDIPDCHAQHVVTVHFDFNAEIHPFLSDAICCELALFLHLSQEPRFVNPALKIFYWKTYDFSCI